LPFLQSFRRQMNRAQRVMKSLPPQAIYKEGSRSYRKTTHMTSNLWDGKTNKCIYIHVHTYVCILYILYIFI
jgi:hypothetical protein